MVSHFSRFVRPNQNEFRLQNVNYPVLLAGVINMTEIIYTGEVGQYVQVNRRTIFYTTCPYIVSITPVIGL